jgi:dephospho-CoA kinase
MHLQKATFTFGITGGIGSGKSAISDMLRLRGVPILDADTIAKTLIAGSTEIRGELMAEFGDEIFHKDGALNRGQLAEIIFRDRNAQQIVNNIVHPRVLSFMFDEIGIMQNDIVGVEAALIFEAKMERGLDAVVVVEAPLEKRLRWLEEKGMSRGESRRRMAVQMSPEKMREKADYWILNDGSMAELASKVEGLFQGLSEDRSSHRGERSHDAKGKQL